ncbi:MAG: type II toxin-antitoxin system RelE/ParE family toxin [Methylobacterium sp.]|nr:type II toxin-antitoxin system RelE/ParE family toxin [Methylobacterium sp.]
MWAIEALNDVVMAEVTALPADQIARFLQIGDLIQAVGLERVREPHVKHTEGPLWEMRMKGRDGISCVSSWARRWSSAARRRHLYLTAEEARAHLGAAHR